MGPGAGIPPGDPDEERVYCRKCGRTSVKKGSWSQGCPRRPDCDGDASDIEPAD